MIIPDLLAQAEDLVRQADFGLLITLANAHYVKRSGETLYDVIIPDTEQTRFGMELAYEEFLLRAAYDPIPKPLSNPNGIDLVFRLARERLASMPIPGEYEIVVRLTIGLTDPAKPSPACGNPLVWMRIGKEPKVCKRTLQIR